MFSLAASISSDDHRCCLSLKGHYCNVLDLLEPSNKALDSNSYYTLFLRVYVTGDIYTSTGWYPVVLTLRDDKSDEGTSM